MKTVQESYEELLKQFNPELYVTKVQLDDIKQRKFGVLTVTYTVQGGKIKTVTRNIEVTNVSDPMTSLIKF